MAISSAETENGAQTITIIGLSVESIINKNVNKFSAFSLWIFWGFGQLMKQKTHFQNVPIRSGFWKLSMLSDIV